MPNVTDSSDIADNPVDHDPLSTNARSNSPSSPEAVTTDAPTTATESHLASAAAEDERDALQTRSVYIGLCEIVRSYAETAMRSDKWGFLARNDSLFRINMSLDELVAALKQKYTSEELSAVGIYERIDEDLRTSSWLDGDAHSYAAIDDVKGTIKLSRGNKFHRPDTPTALDYLLQRTPLDTALGPVTLFVVESQDSVEVMHRLGLHAVSSHGLEALGGNDVQKIFGGDQRSDYGWRYSLLLLDFDLANLDRRPTAAIGEVITRLADAADVYGIDPARRFGVCRPRAHEFRMLERAIKFRDSVPICQLFEAWAVAAKGVIVNGWRAHFDTQAVSYSKASAALNRALQLQDVARRAAVLDALPAYRAAGQTVVIEKFKKAVDTATDPFDQMDLIAAAGHAEAFFDRDPLVRAGEAVLAGKNPPSTYELQDALFEQRQRCLMELRRIRQDRKLKR